MVFINVTWSTRIYGTNIYICGVIQTSVHVWFRSLFFVFGVTTRLNLKQLCNSFHGNFKTLLHPNSVDFYNRRVKKQRRHFEVKLLKWPCIQFTFLRLMSAFSTRSAMISREIGRSRFRQHVSAQLRDVTWRDVTAVVVPLSPYWRGRKFRERRIRKRAGRAVCNQPRIKIPLNFTAVIL